MWVQSHSKVYPNVKKQDVWQMWADVNHYTQWHDDLDYCQLQGSFSIGNYFMLKPKGAPAVKVEIIELIENKKFVDCTRFFGAKMFDIHELEETQHGLQIKNTIQVTGLLHPLWVQLVAKKVAASAPKEMDSLVNLLRTRYAQS